MPHTQRIKAKVSFADVGLFAKCHLQQQATFKPPGAWPMAPTRSGAAGAACLFASVNCVIYVWKSLTLRCLSVQGNPAYQANLYGAPYEASHAQHAGRK